MSLAPRPADRVQRKEPSRVRAPPGREVPELGGLADRVQKPAAGLDTGAGPIRPCPCAPAASTTPTAGDEHDDGDQRGEAPPPRGQDSHRLDLPLPTIPILADRPRACVTRPLSGDASGLVAPGDSSDQQPGAEVGAEHRADLRCRRAARAEDLGAALDQPFGVIGGLRVLDDPVASRRARGARRGSAPCARGRGAWCARGRPA